MVSWGLSGKLLRMNRCIGGSLAIAFYGFAGLLLIELSTYFTAIVSEFGMTKAGVPFAFR